MHCFLRIPLQKCSDLENRVSGPSGSLEMSLTKFAGGLLRLHEAGEAAVDWLTTYGS